MSMQAGIWNFDGQPIDPQWIDRMSAALAQHGPDGESIWRTPRLAMLYRPFHTTPESRFENQPHHSRRGNVMTWDGRLDNREDLLRELGYSELDDHKTDAAIVMAAYDRWGTNSFTKLEGDFCLVIWDWLERCLYLAEDFAGPRQLFYLLERDRRVMWSSRLEPLVQLAERQFTPDEEWWGTYLIYRPVAYRSPYAEIRPVGPAHSVRITPNRVDRRRYWTWNIHRSITYKTDAEYEEHFRHVFRQSIRRRLRTDSSVMAELSGGVDSATILAFADNILAKEGAPAPRIDTLSYCEPEPMPGAEAYYVAINERHRDRAGTHITIDHPWTIERPAEPFCAWPMDVIGALKIDRLRDQAMQAGGCRIVLSGIGGDEVGGAIPYPFGQLADCVVNCVTQFRLGEFARLLQAWAIKKKMPLAKMLGWTLGRLLPGRLGRRVDMKDELEPWLDPEFARRHNLRWRQTSQAFELPWFCLPSRREFADAFESEREILKLHGPALVGVDQEVYPYMDRSVAEFMMAIPATQRLRPGERRSLVRRSAVGLTPDEVLWRKAKAGGRLEARESAYGSALPLVRSIGPHSARQLGVLPQEARKYTTDFLEGKVKKRLMALRLIEALAWLQDQKDRDALSQPADDVNPSQAGSLSPLEPRG